MKVGITLLKKLKKQKKKDYNWVGKYIKEYNERVLYYEKQLAEKNKMCIRDSNILINLHTKLCFMSHKIFKM